MNLDDLKTELTNNSITDVINKHILGGNPICFSGNLELIMELKKALSDHFNIHMKNIEIVGSAKLGVSLSIERFGQSYNEKSDIDMVLVSSELFDLAWHDLLKFDFSYHKLNPKDRESLKECYDTIHRGFISPDKLPPSSSFTKNWWTVFSSLSNREKYEYRKVRGRLFKNWWFVEKYYSIQLVILSK